MNKLKISIICAASLVMVLGGVLFATSMQKGWTEKVNANTVTWNSWNEAEDSIFRYRRIDNEYVAITGFAWQSVLPEELVFPHEFGGYPVTHLGTNRGVSIPNNSGVKTVVISASITTIRGTVTRNNMEIEEIIVDPLNTHFRSVDNKFLIQNSNNRLVSAVNQPNKDVVIPSCIEIL